MLARINEIERIDEAIGEPVGLKYQQKGAEHRSAHFDLKPLIRALLAYDINYSFLLKMNEGATEAAWIEVGIAQRDVPAHVAQEYCRPDRAFFPLPSFNVDREDIPRETLPRVLEFYKEKNRRYDLWFPLRQADSGLGVDFAVTGCDGRRACATHWMPMLFDNCESVRIEAMAIKHLDAVRTEDLKLSRAHLKPSSGTHGLSM